MRYVARDKFQPKKEWLDEANSLLEQLKAAPDAAARGAIIDANRPFWGELKKELLELSHEKCWFSEAKDCFSHFDVEHYRPKKSANELNGVERDAYWWLAFDWCNFRICGTAGNRKKSTFFPNRPGAQYASGPDDDLRVEDPMLLDPADPHDPILLSFNVEGAAIVSPSITDTWQRQRAQYSIERLNLDFPALMDRRKLIWGECWNRLQDYFQELAKLEKNAANESARTGVRTVLKSIRAMLSEKQELSAVVRACILSTGDMRAITILQT